MKAKRLFQFLWYELGLWFVWLLTFWMPEATISFKLRGFLSKPFFKKCGKNFQYGRDVHFLAPWGIEIGNDVYIASGCWISGGSKLVLEDEILVGPYTIITTGSHVFKNGSFRFGGFRRLPVKIGKGTWLASHVIVTEGVTIGKGVLVAANAAVTKDVPNDVIVGGVPAKVISDRVDADLKDN